MRKVLFVMEKWCDLNPNLSWTNSFHNHIDTFRQFSDDKFIFDTIHLDEAERTYNTHIDKILPEYCKRWGADIVLFSLLNSSCDPSLECYKQLSEMGIYTIILWPDAGPIWGIQEMTRLNPYINIHLSWDKVPQHDVPNNLVKSKVSNHLCLWTPQNETLYYPDTKNIDVSFLGSVAKYPDRINFINFVNNHNLNIVTGGGQRAGKLTPEAYASIIRHSKIGINFSSSQTGVFHQAKGRIFEYIASGSLLLEQRNDAIRDFFEEDKHYVAFSDFQELVDKIQYYLNNEDERLAIAQAGYEHFKQNWTSNHYWTQLMEEVDNEKNCVISSTIN